MLQFKIFQPHQDQIIHGFTVKKEGDFKENQPEFQPSIDQLKQKLSIDTPVTTHQIHGKKVALVDEKFSSTPEADALITQLKNKPIMVKVADCQGILIYDPITQSIAAIHSGWKSSCQNIIAETIHDMKTKFNSNPIHLLVAIGPSLGPCCCEFSDPKNELPEFIHPYILKNNHVNFWQLSIDQLKKAGVPEKQIELFGDCTKCHPKKYHSHRNRHTERMGVFISLKTI